MESLGQRLDKLMRQQKPKRATQKDVAAICDVQYQSVQKWLKDIAKPSTDNLIAIAEHFGTTTDYLLNGEEAKKPIESNVGGVVEMRLWSSNDPLPEDEFAFLPFLKDVEFQGGDGCFATEDYNGYKLAFSKATLHRHGIQPNKAVMVSVSGDSMEPVLPDGATVGINMAEKNIIDGKIYAITHGDLLRVKRLYRLPNGCVRINSFNDIDYKDETVPISEIEVVGKVFTWQVMV